MCDICGDNRFEIIESYKRELIEATNIESSPEEMAVIDNILFRFWQMGWLPSAEPQRKKGEWKPFDLTYGRRIFFCTACNNAAEVPTDFGKPMFKFCPWCGAEMITDKDDTQ